jgi:lactocepin
MRPSRRLLILSVLATSVIVACSGDSVTNPFAPLALELTLSPSVDTILVSDSINSANSTTFALHAKSLGLPIQTPRGVVWTSSNPSVAVVDSSGAIFAVSRGTTTITARINSEDTQANVVVAYKVTRVIIEPSTLSGHVGDTLSVLASALDAGGVLVNGMIYTFSSLDPTVASVTKIGTRGARVQFLKAGTARVSVVSGGQAATATGTVTP